MSVKELLELVNSAANGVDNFSKGAVGFNGFGFSFKNQNSDLPYVKTIHSSKFCQLNFTRNFEPIKKKYPYIDEQKYEILLGSTLKTFVPSIQYGGIETLYEVWMFVRTPDERQFPATFYYGPSGGTLGGWRTYKDDEGKNRFPEDFAAIINFSPFDFSKKELRILVEALESALKKAPLSNYYGVYKHDTGNTLMGVKFEKPFYMELYSDPDKVDLEDIFSGIWPK